jgi:hypothetical protein
MLATNIFVCCRYQLVAVLAACVAFTLSVPGHLYQIGRIDPLVYVGYATAWDHLLDQFGRSYYSARVSHIFPLRFLFSVTDPFVAFLIWKAVTCALFVVAIFRISKFFYRDDEPWVSPIAVIFSPLLQYTLTSTYVTGTAIAYFLLSLSYLLAPIGNRAALSAMLAGVFAAFAINAYLWLAAFVILFGPSLLLITSWRDSKGGLSIPRIGAFFTAGALVGYGALTAVGYILNPSHGFFLDADTFSTALWLLSGGATEWHKPLRLALVVENRWYILAPFFLLFAAFTFIRDDFRQGKRDKFLIGAALYLVLIIALYSFDQFIRHSGSITTHFTYMNIPLTLISVALIARVIRDSARQWRLAKAAVLLLSLCAIWFLPTNAGVWVLLGVATAIAITLALHMALPLAVGASMVLFSVSCFQTDPQLRPYARAEAMVRLKEGHDHALERDLIRGAVSFARFVATNVNPKHKIRFWYDYDSPFLHSIQSTFLWGYTRFDTTPVDPTSSKIPDLLIDEIRQTDQVVFLLGTEQNTDAVFSALKEAGIELDIVKSQCFDGNRYSFCAIITNVRSQSSG